MTLTAVLTLFLVCIALALAICLPVMLIVRAVRRKRGPAAAPSARREIPSHELPGMLAGVCVLFLGFAQAYLAPDTWFGQQMTTNTGRLVFSVGIYIAYALGLLILRRIGRRVP